MMKRINIIMAIFMAIGLLSCSKDWLDKKPNVALVVPSNLTDLQALLDNTLQSFNRGSCFLGEIGADNYYVDWKTYQSLTTIVRNAYIWEPDVFNGASSVVDWSNGYTQILYANVVLDGLSKLESKNDFDSYNNVLGSALFYKAFAYLDMAQVFAKAYDASTANSDLGLVLKDAPEINDNPPRATVQKTYEHIIESAKRAASVLPVVPKFKTRPSKPAAFALLARAYVNMRDYDNAYRYADSCLMLYDKMLDFKNLNPKSSIPITIYNDEVIFHNSTSGSGSIISATTMIIDSLLYGSYNNHDLRKSIFFKLDKDGKPRLFGNFRGSITLLFNGLATDEMYMIRAESACRLGRFKDAINDLNTILKARWDNTFIPLEARDQQNALNIILEERRKELCFRGLRWPDLKRLNKEPAFQKTLYRKLNGEQYKLEPADDRYVYPIPLAETNFNPNIIQNPR